MMFYLFREAGVEQPLVSSHRFLLMALPVLEHKKGRD